MPAAYRDTRELGNDVLTTTSVSQNVFVVGMVKPQKSLLVTLF